MQIELSDREVKFLLAWSQHDGQEPVEIGQAAGLSQAASEVIAKKFDAMGYGTLTFGGFSLTSDGQDAIEQVQEALKKQEEARRIDRM